MLRKVCAAAALSLAFTGLGHSAAPAVDLHKSRLSAIELKQCRVLRKHSDGGAWLCRGIRGFPVYFAEGDLRHMLAFGPAPQRRRSATQTLGPFNTIFDGKRRPTIEWRVERIGGRREVPYATIVRYKTSNEGRDGEMLVVTKVTATDSCQLAVIDSKATPDAMVIARSWTVAEARKRPCPDKPEVLGVKGN